MFLVLLVISAVGVVSSLFVPRARVICGLVLCGMAVAGYLVWGYVTVALSDERARTADLPDLFSAATTVLIIGLPWLIWGHLTTRRTSPARR